MNNLGKLFGAAKAAASTQVVVDESKAKEFERVWATLRRRAQEGGKAKKGSFNKTGTPASRHSLMVID